MFSSLSISKKLGLLIGSALLGVALLAAGFLISERTLVLEERQSGVRQTVEIAHTLVNSFHQMSVQGKMPEDEAKRRALEAMKALRYSGSEYFWINDMHPKMVMHAVKPELDGKDLTENKDPTGKHLFVEFVKTVKASGAGFVYYMWPKPGSENPVQKVSYVQGFAPWGWVIGSGVYIDNVDAALAKRVWVFTGATVLLGAALLLVGLLIARSMLRQLGGEPAYAAQITRRIADGDLGVHIALKPNDSTSLLHAIAGMRSNFANIVGQVRLNSDSVATASAEIATGNSDLSRRTELQASALQETAASMEQLGTTVRQNADNAQQANQLAQSASEVATQGGEVVGQVVETMRGINDSSKKIADIIWVSDGIAFPPNILPVTAGG